MRAGGPVRSGKDIIVASLQAYTPHITSWPSFRAARNISSRG